MPSEPRYACTGPILRRQPPSVCSQAVSVPSVLLRVGAATVMSWVALPTSAGTGKRKAAAVRLAVVAGGKATGGLGVPCSTAAVVVRGTRTVVRVTVAGAGVRVVTVVFGRAVVVTVAGAVAVTVTPLELGVRLVGVVPVAMSMDGSGPAGRLAVVSEP